VFAANYGAEAFRLYTDAGAILLLGHAVFAGYTAVRAKGAPADVFSLSKTPWVLATGQAFPFPR
jgi:hypothetical protein